MQISACGLNVSSSDVAQKWKYHRKSSTFIMLYVGLCTGHLLDWFGRGSVKGRSGGKGWLGGERGVDGRDRWGEETGGRGRVEEME